MVVSLGSAAEAAPTATSTSFVLAQSTVSGSGANAVSASYVLDGTAGQESVVGEATSTSFVLESGFWTGASALYTVTVAAAGTGAGSISGTGIACTAAAAVATGDCSEAFTHGVSTSFVAAPTAGHAFDGWSGCDTLSTTTLADDTCEITVLGERTITATFTALATVGDRVWSDYDGDGVQDAGEPGLVGVDVSIADGGGTLATATTGAGGFYTFTDVYPGTYRLAVDPATLPGGHAPSYDLDGVATPHQSDVTLLPGQARTDADFGYQASADLAITKTDSADPLPGGDNLIYTITVENLGPAAATGVTVTDVLPAGTSLVSTSGCAEDPSGVSTCSLGSLAPGQKASFTVEVSIDPAPPASIVNTASVAAIEHDPVPANDEAEQETALDAAAPTITSVDTIATTADGELVDCETVHARKVTRLLVTFSEAMKDPAGSTEPGDVTNPSGWSLVGAGPDAELSSSGCGSQAGDDEAVALTGVGYAEGSNVATLEIADDGGLPAGPYRLFACGTGTGALVDLAGNPLDGDGSGTAGEDFALSFRADPENLLANGHFDCGLEGWVEVEASASDLTFSTDDVDGSATSGSAAAEDPLGSSQLALAQCVPVSSESPLALDARVRMTTGGPGTGVVLTCAFYGDESCTGSPLVPATSTTTLLADTGLEWAALGRVFAAPSEAQGALCAIGFASLLDESFTARLDRVILTQEPVDLIFQDGFETGDASSWSAAIPAAAGSSGSTVADGGAP